MIALRIQTTLWIVFLGYYGVINYSAGSDSWDSEYATQVALLVFVTAVFPYYLTRWLTGNLVKSYLWFEALFLPVVFCAIGYALFYYLQLGPWFVEVTLVQVLLRSFFPGIVISILLLLPVMATRDDEHVRAEDRRVEDRRKTQRRASNQREASWTGERRKIQDRRSVDRRR